MDSVKAEVPHNRLGLIGIFAALSVLYFVGSIIHRLFFHPLHHVPGPWINAISRIPYARHLIAGTTVQNVQRLHDKYGGVVRLSPNEISFITGETAWQDIYGFRTGKLKGHETMLKDPAWYAPPPFGSQIIVANNEDHSRFRRTLSHAFSEKALAQQEGLLQSYVDLLVNRMKEVISTAKGPQDMSRWFNWTTFDIIADLTFGESFECLETLSTNKYIPVLFASLAAFRLNYLFYYWPFARRFKSLFFSAASLQGRADFYQWIASQTQKRIERDTERPDFMTEILKHNGEKGQELSERELANNASVMMGAGSETTATLLSGATFCLLKNPDVMQKLKDDVRGQWKNYGDITLDEVNKSHYLLAVLQEALRYFPPVPTGFERKVPPGGDVVSGYYIPEGTALSVSSWPSGHSERNFKDPDAFVPERWMGDPRYEDDNRDAIQPFSFGPRNCLGKNLAYAEMRLILAKLIWSFDMELDPKCEKWMEECRVYTLWDKPALLVHVKEPVRN